MIRAADDFSFIRQRMHTLSGNGPAFPESWSTVLRKIQAQPDWDTVIIAGGALRDYELGRQIKDVDIFVPHSQPACSADVEPAFAKLAHAFPDFVIVQAKHSNANQLSQGMVGINHYVFKFNGWKFEISQKFDIPFSHLKVLEGFDLGICMISWDGTDLYKSDEYNRDVANQTITIVRPTGGREMEHAERIKQKYEDWTIVPLP